MASPPRMPSMRMVVPVYAGPGPPVVLVNKEPSHTANDPTADDDVKESLTRTVGDTRDPTDWGDVVYKRGAILDPLTDDDEALEQYALDLFEEAHELQQAVIHATHKIDKTDPRRWWDLKKIMRDMEANWNRITPEQFVQVLEFIGPDAQNYVQSMTIHLDPKVWGMGELDKVQRLYPGKAVMLCRKHIGCEHDKKPFLPEYGVKGSNEASENKKLAKELGWVSEALQQISIGNRQMIFGNYKTGFNCHWTTANLLLSKDCESQIHLVKALADTGVRSGVFNTPMGRTILEQAWSSVWPVFLMERIFDVMLLALLSIHQYHLYKNAVSCHPLVGAGIIIITFKNMLVPLLQLIMCVVHYGSSCEKFFGFINFCFFGIDMFVGIVLVEMIMYDFTFEFRLDHMITSVENKEKAFLFNHPIIFMSIIFLKWIQFILSMNCTKIFGENVLPAFSAVTSKEALVYVCFLSMCCLGVFQAYYILPIEENHQGSIWVPFLKIYRLLFLGDFDVEELEGEDPPFAATSNVKFTGGNNGVKNFTLTGGLDDAEVDTLAWVNGVRIGFCICSMTITIMIMNVGIGLLSSLYDDRTSVRHQLHSNYKSEYTVKLLFLKNLFHCLCPCFAHHDDECPSVCNETELHAKPHPGHMCGSWIVADSSQLKDKSDIEQISTNLDNTNQSTNRQIKTVHEMLKKLEDRMKHIPAMPSQPDIDLTK